MAFFGTCFAEYMRVLLSVLNEMFFFASAQMVNSRRGVSPSTWIVTTPWATAPLSVISSSCMPPPPTR